MNECMYIQGSPVGIRNLTQWNMVGDSVIALPPSSNFPPTLQSLRSLSCKGKSCARLQRVVVSDI